MSKGEFLKGNDSPHLSQLPDVSSDVRYGCQDPDVVVFCGLHF